MNDLETVDRYLLTLVNLGILFFPGVIGTFILLRFTYHKERTPFVFLLFSFVIGMLAFVFVPVFGVENGCVQVNWPSFSFVSEIGRGKWSFLQEHIFEATIWAILITSLFSLAERKKWIFTVSTKLRITDRGQGDLWAHAHSIFEKDSEVRIRNIKEQVIYEGTLEASSESFKEAEILLSDVKIYSDRNCVKKGEYLYTVPYLYLSLDPSAIEMEHGSITKEMVCPQDSIS